MHVWSPTIVFLPKVDTTSYFNSLDQVASIVWMTGDNVQAKDDAGPLMLEDQCTLSYPLSHQVHIGRDSLVDRSATVTDSRGHSRGQRHSKAETYAQIEMVYAIHSSYMTVHQEAYPSSCSHLGQNDREKLSLSKHTKFPAEMTKKSYKQTVDPDVQCRNMFTLSPCTNVPLFRLQSE